jgi:hypothetical protein
MQEVWVRGRGAPGTCHEPTLQRVASNDRTKRPSARLLRMRPTLTSEHWSVRRLVENQGIVPLTAVVWAVLVGALISVGGNLGVRGALLVSALPLVIAVVGRSTRGTLIGLVVWLVALGLIRRLISSGTGASVSHDPLLLVGPAALGALFIVSIGRGAFRQRTPLASSVLLLSLFGLIEAFNPLQGGLIIGLGGLLLVTFPMLAFWVGRVLVTRIQMRQILNCLPPWRHSMRSRALPRSLSDFRHGISDGSTLRGTQH